MYSQIADTFQAGLVRIPYKIEFLRGMRTQPFFFRRRQQFTSKQDKKKKLREMKRPVHGVKPELVMPDRLVICVQPR